MAYIVVTVRSLSLSFPSCRNRDRTLDARIGLARIPAKLEASSKALTRVMVPPDLSAMVPRFSRSQASLSTETTSTVTPFSTDWMHGGGGGGAH